MADTKITNLSQLTAMAGTDVLPAVDVSDTTMAASGTTKHVTLADLMRNVPDGTEAAPGSAFASDQDTGLFRPAADTLAMSAGGVEGLRVVESGGDITTTMLPNQTESFTFNEGSSTGDATLRVGAGQSRAGVIVKMRDGGLSGTMLGCYDLYGNIKFEVNDGSINFGSPVSLSAGSSSGEHDSPGYKHGFHVGGFDNGHVQSSLVVSRDSYTRTPDTGDLITFRVNSADNSELQTAKWVGDFVDASNASYKARHALEVSDFNESREVLRCEADGTQAKIGFLGVNAAAQQSHIADPSGGSTVDSEARTAINSILSVLETFGFTATS